MRPTIHLLNAALIGAVMSVACAGSTGPGSPGGSVPETTAAPKRMSVAIRGAPTALSARIDGIGSGSVPGVTEVERLINAGLTITDHELVSRPQLAKESPTVENGLWKVMPDGRMETTWHIRDGVKWHDGTPFTSADAVFTTQVEQGLELLSEAAYKQVESVEAPDPMTVRVLWKQPYIKAQTLFDTVALPMPKHLLEEQFRTLKDGIVELPYWNAGYIGTGPFRVKDYVPAVHAVLAKNPDYVLGAPKIDEIEVKFISDPGTLGANILAGTVDLTLGGRLALDWGVQVRDQWRDGRMVSKLDNQISAWPQFLNPSPAVLGNVQMRRALWQAVDRKQMADTLVDGLSPIADSVVRPSDAEYKSIESSLVRYPYDPQRAAQLITGLGYTKGPNGMFQGPDGPLRVEIRTRSNDDSQVKTTLAMADDWDKLGVGVDQVHFAAQQANDREWRATRPGFEVVRQPSGVDSFNRYLGTSTPVAENRFSGENRTRYQNAELDGYIQKYLTTIPMAERMSYAAQIVHHMTDQVVIMTMFYDVIPTMISNRLGDMAGPGTTWDAHQWTVK
jgi:peptide/nickel transport system substrate-binding protein